MVTHLEIQLISPSVVYICIYTYTMTNTHGVHPPSVFCNPMNRLAPCGQMRKQMKQVGG